tara:strand:+ start:1576 stop:1794 length:219 start_codon:yes stop_codon:yes gene_type:complete
MLKYNQCSGGVNRWQDESDASCYQTTRSTRQMFQKKFSPQPRTMQIPFARWVAGSDDNPDNFGVVSTASLAA